MPSRIIFTMLIASSNHGSGTPRDLGKMRSDRPALHRLILLLLLVSAKHGSAGAAQNQPIKTVVVLVLENRSFDHMLGWMKTHNNPAIDGVTGVECNPVSTRARPGSPSVCVSDDAEFVDPDPGHSFEAVAQQVFGASAGDGLRQPTMSGFLEQALSMPDNQSNAVMRGFNPNSIPVYQTLVEEFAVFDRWFSSLPGPTQPNRLFVYSATSHGATSHVKRDLVHGYPQKTIFDSLHDDGHGFGIYYQSIPTTLFYKNLRKLKYVFNFHRYGTFKRHAREGRLPSLAVIEPAYFDVGSSPANDDHPSHDIANGQRLVKEVYEALRASPQWEEAMLVVTYDEHGGFFDHVPTPVAGIPNPDGNTGPPPFFFQFDRLGVRVPTIMVSPWIRKGTVVGRPNGPTKSSEYEHSSIPATIKKIFNLKSNFLTRRDAWAGTFEQVVTQLDSPRRDCPQYLPEPIPLRKGDVQEGRKLSEFQREVVQLAAVLNGDHHLSSFLDEIHEKMTVRRAHNYVSGSISRFIRASREALKMGANGSVIVDMRPSLTSRQVP